MKTVSIFFLFISLLLAGTAGAQQEEEFISLDFHQVDINLFIRFVSEITGTNFIVDPRVTGHITVISPTKISVDAVYPIFKSILEMHGFSLVQADEMVKVVPSVEARHRAIQIGIGREIEEIPPEDTIVTQLIPLRYVHVNQVRAILAPLVSRASNMVPHLPTNTLILTEVASNIQRLLKIIEEIDIEGVGIERRVIPLKFASAGEIVPTITSAIERQLGAPERVLKIIPDERTNSLVIAASAEDMGKIEKLIEELDREAPPLPLEVHVYRLENAKAEELAEVLGGLPAQGVVRGGAQVEPTIVTDEATNSLIIAATPEDHIMFEEVIEQLDIVQRQVLVEMLIIEASVDVIRQLGAELAGAEQPVEGEVTAMAITNFVDAIATAGAGLPGLVLGAIRGTTAVMGREVPNVIAIIQAHAKDIGFEVLASPHIVTSNNEEAHILIGERIPFVKEARIVEEEVGVAPTVIKTFDYRDVGIELGITPRITPEGLVHLNIEGSISKVVGEPVNGTITTIERRISTVMTIEDGGTAVIGGLTRDDKSKTVYRVPVLGYIPILGVLFRRHAMTAVQRNLLIFLTPRIIETAAEVEEIRREKTLQHEEFREREPRP